MSTVQEQIEKIEKEIRETPYHKGTEHYIGKLRAKLSKLGAKKLESATRGKGGGVGYAVKKQGDATVVLIGAPSVGKSTLLNKLTSAKSKIAPYEFTTVSVIPGMMEYKNAKIQILDVPGLIEGAEESRGRGREVMSVARGADLLLIMCDVDRVAMFESIVNSLEKVGIRTNQVAPRVNIEKKVKGGLIIRSNIKQELGKVTIKEVANELGIKNAEITIKEKLSLESLIDAFSTNRIYIPAIFVVNKVDLEKQSTVNSPRSRQAKSGTVWNLAKRGGQQLTVIYVSAKTRTGLSKLREEIWNKLKFVKVYLVRGEEKPSKNNPLIMKSGQTLGQVAEKIGNEFVEDKIGAKIWGPGSKFPGQKVSLKTAVVEGMQVRFI